MQLLVPVMHNFLLLLLLLLHHKITPKSLRSPPSCLQPPCYNLQQSTFTPTLQHSHVTSFAPNIDAPDPTVEDVSDSISFIHKIRRDARKRQHVRHVLDIKLAPALSSTPASAPAPKKIEDPLVLIGPSPLSSVQIPTVSPTPAPTPIPILGD